MQPSAVGHCEGHFSIFSDIKYITQGHNWHIKSNMLIVLSCSLPFRESINLSVIGCLVHKNCRSVFPKAQENIPKHPQMSSSSYSIYCHRGIKKAENIQT